jgi:hypothetical protein
MAQPTQEFQAKVSRTTAAAQEKERRHGTTSGFAD